MKRKLGSFEEERLHPCVGCNSTALTAVETLPAADLIAGQPGSVLCCTSGVAHGGGGRIVMDACIG